MQQWNSNVLPTVSPNGSAVTIGKYDAIHIGHQEILQQLVTNAKRDKLTSVLLTFTAHPNSILEPSKIPLPIIGPKLKAQYVADSGVEAMYTLDFDQALAELDAEEFVSQYLVTKLSAKLVIVGEGFRFGVHGSGSCDTLRDLGAKYGFEVVEVQTKKLDGEVVSTTAVRDALEAGDVVLAGKLLGRGHINRGAIEHGLKIGRTIGFPTANLSRNAEGYLPLDGVYAGWLHDQGKKYPTAISVGINETFQAVPRLAEAFVLDHTGLDLYDHIVDFEYVEFIRPAAKFNGVEDLVAEINRDLVKIRQVLGI